MWGGTTKKDKVGIPGKITHTTVINNLLAQYGPPNKEAFVIYIEKSECRFVHYIIRKKDQLVISNKYFNKHIDSSLPFFPFMKLEE